jgi:hypothetical protein
VKRQGRSRAALGDPYGTHAPEGQYRAGYDGYEAGWFSGQERWFAHFRITEPGEFHGNRLVRFYNVPRRSYLPRSHNLRLDFERLLGVAPSPRVTPDDFLKGTEVLVEVVTVTGHQQGRKRLERPAELHYSKINRLIRYTAGSPPCRRSGLDGQTQNRT